MSKKMSINDIMMTVQTVANENGEELSYTNKMTYLKMIEYAEKYSAKDCPVWISFEVTTVGFAKYCQVSQRMVTETLRKLDACGVLRYRVKHPHPSIVTLYKKYYEK